MFSRQELALLKQVYAKIPIGRQEAIGAARWFCNERGQRAHRELPEPHGQNLILSDRLIETGFFTELESGFHRERPQPVGGLRPVNRPAYRPSRPLPHFGHACGDNADDAYGDHHISGYSPVERCHFQYLSEQDRADIHPEVLPQSGYPHSDADRQR